MDVDRGEGAVAGSPCTAGGRGQQQQQQAGGVVDVTTHLREFLLDGTVTASEEMVERLAEGGAAGGGMQRITLKHIDGEGGLLETAFEVGTAGQGLHSIAWQDGPTHASCGGWGYGIWGTGGGRSGAGGTLRWRCVCVCAQVPAALGIWLVGATRQKCRPHRNNGQAQRWERT